MKEFNDKVAVITGAASGIGRAIAERCIGEGMKVVLADIEADALAATAKDLLAQGGRLRALPVDVSKADEVESLARATVDTFGAVHLLFNNAGVAGQGAGGVVWRSKREDWEWVLGVNLWGVVHGLRSFVPIMLAQDEACHIVNTASMGGVVGYEPSAAYHASKHAVVALSENLHHSLARQQAKIKASVLCPGWVSSRVMDAERNRPSGLKVDRNIPPLAQAALAEQRRQLEAGMPPEQVAGCVFAAIRSGKFYIFTHPGQKSLIRLRMEEMLDERNPTFPEEVETALNAAENTDLESIVTHAANFANHGRFI